MRLLFVVGWLAAGVALADVPGPQTVCDGPKCTVCTDTACANTALDAGLLLSECTSKNLTYYCPPGEDAVARCGCASTPANILLGLGALAALLRKRR